MSTTGQLFDGLWRGIRGIFASSTSVVFRAYPDAASVDKGQAVIIDIAANDDAPFYGMNLDSIVIITDANHGTTDVNGDGTVTYTHDDGTDLTDSFTYTIDNNNGDTSNIAMVAITINAAVIVQLFSETDQPLESETGQLLEAEAA